MSSGYDIPKNYELSASHDDLARLMKLDMNALRQGHIDLHKLF